MNYTCAQWGFSMKEAREREMSEMWLQKGHWCRMEDDMVVNEMNVEKRKEKKLKSWKV
jgi:hypothetical protein